MQKKSLEMIKKDNPKDPIMMLNYGNLYRAMNKPNLAIKYYKQAIRFADNDSFGKKTISERALSIQSNPCKQQK
ncbi:MAG TPA: tetratricopeptide repeat protein [Candidatus Paceibacterota bacterium]|nr:tetratricopeptide repeat protein [Candidatus Paceibacterota bacterium]